MTPISPSVHQPSTNAAFQRVYHERLAEQLGFAQLARVFRVTEKFMEQEMLLEQDRE